MDAPLEGRLLALAIACTLQAGSPAQAPQPDAGLLRALTFRSIGPAITGGRVADIAVVENRPSSFYVAASIGGLWKTVNSGTSWEPVFEAVGSAAMGDVAVASSNPDVVWGGTGESNADHASWVTACTSRPMPVAPGPTSGCATRTTSGAS